MQNLAQPAPPPGARRGFSLFEMLVATALVGVVIGLAVQGFSEAKKLGDMARARMVARQEANGAVQKIAKIVRRSHIIFFDPRPLGQMATPETVNLGNIARDTNPPEFLLDQAAGDSVEHRWASPRTPAYITPFTGWGSQARGLFRAGNFNLPAGAGTTDTVQTAVRYIRTAALLAAGAPAENRFDHYFPSPLLYCAEAQFVAGRLQTPAGGTEAIERADAGLPISWTFYLVYLAPMRLPASAYVTGEHGLLPVVGGNFAQRDQLAGGATRAPVPLELRLLTIPDVRAVRSAAAATAGANGVRTLNTGRQADTTSVVPPPFDLASNNANYDPIPLPMLNQTYTQYASTGASGARIRGVSRLARLHCNWGNVGNDPPSPDAFQARAQWTGTGYGVAARPVRDQLLASYIDPDSVHGTCVRLGNDWVRNNNGDIGLLARGEGAPRPYVNATGGPQTYSPRFWNANNPLTVGPPRRALISVATRFRYTKQTPFAFATESIEVELEALNRFQDMSFRIERR